jgi:ankyrin repeat protein
VVELLLQNMGVIADSGDSNGRTPLSWAAENGHSMVVELLLQNKGVIAGSGDSKGRTPLSWAAEGGQDKAVKLIVENGADVSAATIDGWTALHYAAKNGHVAVVQMLFEKTDVDAMTRDGTTALQAALLSGKLEVVKLLLFADNVTFRNLLQKEKLDLMKILLAAGYHVDTTDTWNRTPLHHAILSGRLEAAKELLSSGAAIDLEDSDGMTPVHLAVQNKKQEFITLLLEHSACTKKITTKEWLDAHGEEPTQIVVLSEEQKGKKSRNFITGEAFERELKKGPFQTAEKRILCVLSFPYSKRVLTIYIGSLFTKDSNLIPEWKAALKRDKLEIYHRPLSDDKSVNFSVAVWFAGGEDPSHEGCFKIHESKKIRITWTVLRLAKPNQGRYWKAMDHYSTLPYGWIPDNGNDFFKDFILLLRDKWLELCGEGEQHLTGCVSRILQMPLN